MPQSTWILVLAALVLGLGAGVALQTLVADLAFGFAFRRSPPFCVGDAITVTLAPGATPSSGVVEAIGRTASTLLSPQGHPLRLPHRVAARSTIEVRRLPEPGTEHTLELRLDGHDHRDRQAAALNAALTHVWADGLTSGPSAPHWHLDRLDGPDIVYRITYAVAPRRHPEAAARHGLLERLHRHLVHAHLALAGDGASRSGAFDATSQADRAACLARTKLFADLPDDERSALAAELHARHEDTGQSVVSQGSPGATMFIVATGVLEACVGASRTERAQRLTTIGPGEFFGEMATLTGAPRSATVATLTPVLLFEIPPATMTALLRRHPTLAEGLSRTMSEYLRRDADRAVAS